CKIHGLIPVSKTIFHKNGSTYCNICIHSNYVYDPIKTKEYNDRHSLRRKDKRLLKRYKIDLKTYNSLLERQDSKCKICKISIEGHQKRKGTNHYFAVDHCHETGRIRGLLCFKCNMGLGYFNDDRNLLKEAVK